jgi:gliding motility-associated-like protein
VVCAHAYDTLTTTTPNSGNTIYQWFVGPNLVLTGGPYQIVTFADTGYVTVKLVVINNGCADTLIKTDYIYVSPPVSISNVLFSCDSPKKVTFLNLSKGATSSKWYYGNGSSIITNANSFSYTYASLGDYPAALVTTNSASGCTDSINFFVTLFKPSYNLTVDDSTICKSSNMPTSLLSSVITGAPVSNYSWRIAGGINTNVTYADTLANIIYSFVDTGHYTIRVKAIDGHGCVDSAVKPGYVTVSKPYVKFGGAPQIGCAPQPVQFADSSRLVSGTSTVSRVWDFGDVVSLSGNVATPSHTYASAGSFDVKLVVTDNNGCSDSLTKPSYINIQSPKAAFTGGGQGCPGVPVSFINGSLGGTAVTYEWDFGDGTPISTVINPQHIYANTGIYTVRLIAKSPNGCRDTATKNGFVIIGQRPTASFSQSDTFSICSPKLVQFTNTSTGAASYNWSFGNNASSTVTSPTNVYSGGGVYTVRLIASSNTGCKDTAYGSVHLLGSAGGLSYGPLTGCEPLTVNFTTAVVNVPSFIFDFGDGSTFGTTGTTASHTYAQAGTYIPKLIMTDNTGCSSSSIGLDTVKVDGVVAGFTTDPNPVCGGGTVKFIDTSKGTYSTVVFRQWDFGNGITSTSANPTQTYNAPGSYPVSMYSRTSSGCVDTFRTVLKVHPIPVINAGTDTVICLNDAATLQPAGGVSYTWSPGATLNCTACTNPEAKPTVPTDYIVIGTDSNGCKDSDTVLVGIKTKTTALIAGGGGVCAGDGLQLSASGAQSYQWIPSTGLSNANVANPFATPASTMTYTVIAKEGSCIPDTERVTVVVNPIPTVNAGPDVTMVAGNSVQLSAITQVSGVSFNWTPATRLSCDNCSDPEASPKTTTTYTVTTKSPFGCTDTDAVTIYVICEQNQVYIPNTFTPNGDGDNELFYPRGKGIEIIKTFRVFNRWGEKVFEKMNIPANDAGNAWDGSYKGAPLPPDVFVFIIEGVCDTGEEFRWQGDVGLVR